MRSGIFKLFAFVGLLWVVSVNGDKLKNFCYFTNWSNKLSSYEARFEIRDINTTLCTHLIYAFAMIDPNKMKLIPSQADDDNGQLYNKQGRYFDFTKLKIRAPHLVTLLSVGGASVGSDGFLPVVHSEDTMRLFSRNCAIYLRDRDFDGINIEWEYPDDIFKDKYTQLLQIMREEFNKEAAKVSKPTLLITIAVGVGQDTIDKSYNVTAISRVVDYIQVLTYDFHGPWSDVTSFSGPLFSRASNTRFDQRLSQAWAIDYWISKGAPAHKLVMGMTGAAVTFTLPNMTNTAVGATVLSPGHAGPYLQRQGHVTYFRVCEMIRHGAVYKWDDEQKMGYAVLDNEWAGYGNEKSMTEKVKFAYKKGIAGTVFWSLDLDDFKGTYCNKGTFPLLNAIYKATQDLATTEPHTGAITARSTTPPSTTLPAASVKNDKLKNFCYFTNWSNKLQLFEARFEIRDINTTLCTHLIYAFANIDPNKMKLIPSQLDDDNGQLYNKQGRYFDFAKLKIRAPHLKTILSVGGASAGNGGFLPVVHSKETMRLFSRNCAIYLRDRDFDGINIDWEYPDSVFKDQYTQLLEVMREEFNKEAAKVIKPTLLITIAVGVGQDMIDKSYNVTAISRVVDYIQVMTFDFHGPWSDVTSFSGPLFSRASDVKFDQRLSQSWAIDYWISQGAPAHKLVMGMTGAAVTFTLPNMTNTGVGAAVLSTGQPGPYLQRQGHVTYFRVCEMIRHGAVYKWDDEQKMGYAVVQDQWVGYANEKSMVEKVKFAYTRGIAGTMFWSLDLDDFQGTYCNKGEFPLLNAIYKATQEFAPKEPFTRVITARPTTPQSTTPPAVSAKGIPPKEPYTGVITARPTTSPSTRPQDNRKPVMKLLYKLWTAELQITF